MHRFIVAITISLNGAACCTTHETRDAVELLPPDEGVSCETICEGQREPDESLLECQFGTSERDLPAAICTYEFDVCPQHLH